MADDVVIRISAKDLSKKSFQDAIRNVAGVGNEAAKSSKKTSGLSTSYKQLVTGIIGANSVMAVAQRSYRALTGFVSDSVDKYARQEQAVKKLNTALEAQGLFTPALSQQYQALASNLQQLTTFGDEALIEMQALLVQVGDVGPEKMEAALQASMDLAVGIDRDLRTAVDLVAKAFAGETSTLKRYGVVVDEARLKTEGIDAVLDVLNQKFGGQAQAQIETYQGKIDQLSNSWGDLKEHTGQAIAESNLMHQAIGFLTRRIKEHMAVQEENQRQAELLRLAREGDREAALALRRALGDLSDKEELQLQLTEQLTARQEEQRVAVEALAIETTSATRASVEFAQAEEAAAAAAVENAKKAKEAARQHREMVEQLVQAEESLLVTQAAVTLSHDEMLLGVGALAGAQINTTRTTMGLGTELDHLIRPIVEVEAGTWDVHEALLATATQLGQEAPPTFFETLRSQLDQTLDDILTDLPDVIVGAFQGGGDVGKTIGSFVGGEIGRGIGTVVTEAVGGRLGSLLGGFLGPLGAIGGSFIGQGISALFKIGGPSDQELEGRSVAANFRQGVITGLNEGQIAEALAAQWENPEGAKFLIGIRDLYVEIGLSAHEATADVNRLWRAEKEGGAAVQQVLDEINAKTGGFLNLQDLQTAKFAEMEAAAHKYGIELADLGNDFQQNKLDEAFDEILNDYRLLTQGGADVDAVLAGMSDEISALVQDSIAFGIEIPANMRPVIESLLDQGLLVDENGKKLASLEDLTFAETLTQGFDRMIDKLDEIVLALTDGVGGAFDDLIHDASGLERAIDNLPSQIDINAIFNAQGLSGRGLPPHLLPRQFGAGTHGEFEDFGPRELVEVHHQEAIVPRSSVSPLAGEIAQALGPVIAGAGGGSPNIIILNGNDLSSLRGTLPRSLIRELDRLMRGGELVMPARAIGERVA